jgi:tetratricopeptide (TPR) repeat protein
MERAIAYNLIRERNKKNLSDALQKASEGLHKSISEDQQAQQPVQGTFSRQEPTEPIKRSFESLKPLQPGQVTKAKTGEAAGKDVYEQMLWQTTEAPPPQAVQSKQQQQPDKQKQTEQTDKENIGDLKSELSKIEKETAENIVGVHKSFATESKDKFNYYMRTAEEFLKQGKYYRAIDAYTLASIYKPQDPLAYAGRAHALFASGEYMSSAYFLAMAINIFPQYVNFKIDLNAMIPDKDRLESRIVDVKQWIEKTESAELGFLLAYIYYQLDKIDLALESINFAAGKMPDSVAVKALKQVIEKK